MIAAYRLGYNYLDSNMPKKLLLDVLRTRPIELYRLKEAVALYDFEDQKMRRDLDRQKKDKAVNYPLVAPRQSNKPGTYYQFHMNNIIDHICDLTYIKTVS